MFDELGMPVLGPAHWAGMFDSIRVPLCKGAKKQMEQADRHHAESLKLSREQMAMQAQIAAAQLELANRPIPVPEKQQPGVTETSADAQLAEAAARQKALRKSGNKTVMGGAGYRSMKTGGTSGKLGAKAAA
jgi:hypothetical protein